MSDRTPGTPAGQPAPVPTPGTLTLRELVIVDEHGAPRIRMHVERHGDAAVIEMLSPRGEVTARLRGCDTDSWMWLAEPTTPSRAVPDPGNGIQRESVCIGVNGLSFYGREDRLAMTVPDHDELRRVRRQSDLAHRNPIAALGERLERLEQLLASNV